MCARRNGQNVTIRQLTIADYDSVVRIWEQAGLPYKPKGRESKEAIAKQIRETPDLLLGAEIGGKLIGVIVGSTEGRKGWLNRIAVVPEQRGKGIARLMIHEGESALRKRGIRIIALLIEKSNFISIKLAKSLDYIPADDILYLTKRESDEV